MAYGGYTKPDNAIVAAGQPLIQELKVETLTSMYPGRLVKKGTADDDIVVNTAKCAAPVGFLGYEQCHPDYKPANEDTLYAASDWVPVLNGGGFVINARLKNGESVIKGDALYGAASGELAKATQHNVESGTTAVTSSTASGNIIDGSMNEEGPIVAYAEETVDASAAAKDILVRSVI